MNKAFTKETDAADDDDEGPSLPPLPAGTKNYITPAGYARLRGELLQLIDEERPKVVEAVHWAALNGDRSENGDYIYGKKRLREIDRRIRFLTKRLDIAEVADPSKHHGSDQIFFGASDVRHLQGRRTHDHHKGHRRGRPPARRRSQLDRPIARALLKAREGDEVSLMTLGGVETLEVLRWRSGAVDVSGA
jgi:transcription elongation factor GreB